MAVKASASMTLSAVVDVAGCTRYYLLQASTLSPPNKPTTKPPTGSWTDTEPAYTSGSTNSLYFTDLTVFSDGTWSYSFVSLSSSYEAAKEAYNRAQAAQSAATDAAAQAETNAAGIQRLDSEVTGLSTQFNVFSGGIQATIEDHSQILSAMTFSPEGLKVQMSGSIYSTLVNDTGFHIDREGTVGHLASFAENGLAVEQITLGDIRAKRTSTQGWAWQALT